MSKTILAAAVTAGALLLPASAAQAATGHHPCDGPGFGSGAFFGDTGFGDTDFFDDDEDDFPFFDDDDDVPFFGDDTHTTVVVVQVPAKTHHHKPKPKPSDDASDNGADAGYDKPANNADDNGNGDDGYKKGA
ncbi:hypothetical protein [Paractinoplanes durhamensis]|uniref:Uncharacterized protein n=1 Tax=Paractinoplanes durhamensis TaxID=113563 RepID=A0ABQ3YQH0_9ACTN|nr:hypothetical protein [Actinoplanes durhamensis]GID99784.1 hypothetical protein Adu01nite_11350 [Actinoplanes durhamensis]